MREILGNRFRFHDGECMFLDEGGFALPHRVLLSEGLVSLNIEKERYTVACTLWIDCFN